MVRLAGQFGTPLYVVDEARVRANCREYKAALQDTLPGAQVLYAGKTMLNLAMARLIDEEGLGLDVVSGGELYTALRARFPAGRIHFHGNNKSLAELTMALEARVGRIVVDNEDELALLATLCRRLKVHQDISLRITPGIEAHTHEYIETGLLDSKFGFGIGDGRAKAAVRKALGQRELNLKGLHCHIGSQLFDLAPVRRAVEVMLAFADQVRRETGWTAPELNLGGGLGIRYTAEDAPPTVAAFVGAITEALRDGAKRRGFPLPALVLEPGRSIVGPAGVTLYDVGNVKRIKGVRTYVSVDGGMAENPRPALYSAKYDVAVANKAGHPPEEVVSVAGRFCESGDMLAWDVSLPKVERGDVMVIFATGAYHYSMASNYNRWPRPAMVFVKDGQAELVVRRETYEDIVAHDVLPVAMREQRAIVNA